MAFLTMAPTASFALTAWEESSADFAKICIAALMAPDALPAALNERGMASLDQGGFGEGWDGTAYSSADHSRSVNVSHQTYSDLKISSCIAVAPKSSSEEMTALRAVIEAQPDIGKLDGKIVQAGPVVTLAMLKRPGNAPIITFNFTSTSAATTLSMNRWDIQAGN
jgi:hypothetical protein